MMNSKLLKIGIHSSNLLEKKYKLSMVDANLDILISCGIPLENIEVCRVSTFNNPELNSARRDGPNYKLNYMISMLGE